MSFDPFDDVIGIIQLMNPRPLIYDLTSLMDNIGQNPISHGRENELLYGPTPGYPQEPKDYCKGLSEMIQDLTVSIAWRNKDMKRYPLNDPKRPGHIKRRKMLEKRKAELEKKYNDFCNKPCP